MLHAGWLRQGGAGKCERVGQGGVSTWREDYFSKGGQVRHGMRGLAAYRPNTCQGQHLSSLFPSFLTSQSKRVPGASRLCTRLPMLLTPSPTPLSARLQLQLMPTQNIDSLEHQAGLPRSAVIAAHGNFDSARCIQCGRRHSMEHVRRAVFRAGGSPCRCRNKVCARLTPEEQRA